MRTLCVRTFTPSGWLRQGSAWDSHSRISWRLPAMTRRCYCWEASRRVSRTRARAVLVLDTLRDELSVSDWYTDEWLDEVLDQLVINFDHACDRWRGLYRAAQSQARAQGLIMLDASRSAEDKKQADRLRAEAESQLSLLTDIGSLEQSDFYSYRYFA